MARTRKNIVTLADDQVKDLKTLLRSTSSQTIKGRIYNFSDNNPQAEKLVGFFDAAHWVFVGDKQGSRRTYENRLRFVNKAEETLVDISESFHLDLL